MGTTLGRANRIPVRSRANSHQSHTEVLPASRRTTVALSPQAQEIVERFKSASGSSTSAAIDQIILRSEPSPSRLKELNGFLVLDVPFRSVNVTLEDIKRAEDEMDREYVERLMPRGKKSIPHGIRAGSR
jgi:hypothetical protein